MHLIMEGVGQNMFSFIVFLNFFIYLFFRNQQYVMKIFIQSCGVVPPLDHHGTLL